MAIWAPDQMRQPSLPSAPLRGLTNDSELRTPRADSRATVSLGLATAAIDARPAVQMWTNRIDQMQLTKVDTRWSYRLRNRVRARYVPDRRGHSQVLTVIHETY
jgi:hypothetical protein